MTREGKIQLGEKGKNGIIMTTKKRTQKDYIQREEMIVNIKEKANNSLFISKGNSSFNVTTNANKFLWMRIILLTKSWHLFPPGLMRKYDFYPTLDITSIHNNDIDLSSIPPQVFASLSKIDGLIHVSFNSPFSHNSLLHMVRIFFVLYFFSVLLSLSLLLLFII